MVCGSAVVVDIGMRMWVRAKTMKRVFDHGMVVGDLNSRMTAVGCGSGWVGSSRERIEVVGGGSGRAGGSHVHLSSLNSNSIETEREIGGRANVLLRAVGHDDTRDAPMMALTNSSWTAAHRHLYDLAS